LAVVLFWILWRKKYLYHSGNRIFTAI